MRILINMIDSISSHRIVRLTINNCNDTTQFIKQISKLLNINKKAYIFRVKNQIVNLRILDGWTIGTYNIKNGTWILIQQNQLYHQKEPSLSSTSSLSLEKIQKGTEDFENQNQAESESLIENQSIDNKSEKNKQSYESHNQQKDYSEYFDNQLTKMLQYVRNNQLSLIASLLKQQPTFITNEEVEKELLVQSKNKYMLNELGQCGRNALHWAIHNQNIQIVTFLLLKHADPSILTIDEYTPLQLAVIFKNIEIVKILLPQPKVDPNKITAHGTALHLAVYHCSIELVKLLLDSGASVESKNNDNRTPLQIAEMKEIKKIFQDDERKKKLRLLKPNITKGNVLKVASTLTYRTKQRVMMSNPFRGDLVFYKQNQIVDYKLSLKSIILLEKINQKSWLMDQKLKYLKVVFQINGNEDKLIIGVKNSNIFQKWMAALEMARTYVNNIEHVQKIQSENQLIEVLDDNKNEVKIHKRQIQGKKMESPVNKHKYSIFDMKINQNQQSYQDELKPKNNSKQVINNKNSQKSNNRRQYFREFAPVQIIQTGSFVSSQDNEMKESQILLGSVINESNYYSPVGNSNKFEDEIDNSHDNRVDLNLRLNSMNLATVQLEKQYQVPISIERINSAPSFRKQSADFSKITEFNLTDQKKQRQTMATITGKSQFQTSNSSTSPNSPQVQKKQISYSHFEFKRLLGSGAFGQVYLTNNQKDAKLYAMKVLNKKRLLAKKHLKYAVSQTNILKKINHPFIIKLHHSFQTPSNLYLTLDYCPNGDLSQILAQRERFTQTTAKFIIVQMILSLEYLHQQKIIYRDLKPENILVAEDGYIKLIDFGLSKENHFATSFCGSPAYLSPEMLQKKGHSFPTDIYGLGCVLYEMVIGQPPFFDENMEQLFDNIKNARLKFPGYLSKQIKSLISRMLQRDVNKRIGSKDFNELKEHEFFKGINWDKILNKKMAAPKQIFPQAVEDEYFKLENKIHGEQIKYMDQEYTQNTKFNRIKGFSFSRE